MFGPVNNRGSTFLVWPIRALSCLALKKHVEIIQTRANCAKEGAAAIPHKLVAPGPANIPRLFCARSVGCAQSIQNVPGTKRRFKLLLYIMKPSLSTSTALCPACSRALQHPVFFGRIDRWQTHRRLSRATLYATTLKGFSIDCPVITSCARIFQLPVGSLKARVTLSRNGVERTSRLRE